MRNARGVSDRLDAQYRDCDGCSGSVVGVIVAARVRRYGLQRPKRKLLAIDKGFGYKVLRKAWAAAEAEHLHLSRNTTAGISMSMRRNESEVEYAVGVRVRVCA
jgi:hypothetical protein